MSIVTYENVDTPIFDIYYPRYLFASGEEGALLPDLSAPAGSLFQDSAGTIPVTAFGDFVGLAKDQSGNGRDWVQATNAARMRYGRMPRTGARNEWSFSDDLTVGVSRNNVTITPDEEAGAFRVTATADTGNRQFYKLFPASRLTQLSLVVKAGSIGAVQLQWNGYANGHYDLLTGVATGETARMTSLGDGWWRISTAGFNPAGSAQAWVLRLPSSAVTGDYILVQHPQVEEPIGPESPPTPYQRVTSPYDITESGVTDQPILYADLADDAMDIELPAINGGTIVLAGDKGIWIDELNFSGGTFSYGPTTYTGGPTNLIESMVGERLIGGFVIDRALTATERAQNIDYYMERGAGQEVST